MTYWGKLFMLAQIGAKHSGVTLASLLNLQSLAAQQICAEERERIVAWLREDEGSHDDINGHAARTFADMIEKDKLALIAYTYARRMDAVRTRDHQLAALDAAQARIAEQERERIVAHLRAVVPYSTNEVERDGLADVIDVIESGEF